MTHYLACEMPPELATRLFSASQRLRTKPVARKDVDEAAAVMLELVELTLDFYFLQPVDRLQVGSFGHATVKLGIKTARGGMAMIINRLAHQLTQDQLVILADLLDGFVMKQANS